jgi:outer membrane protein assembly factor BamB
MTSLVIILAGLSLTAEPKGEDWPKFLGPRGDSTSLETGLLTAWPKSGLKKLWDCKLGEGFGPPSVAAGKLYHFDIADQKAILTCRDAATGQQLWTFDYPCTYRDQYGYDGTRCCPVIDEDRVYIYGPEGVLHCVKDGKKLWAVDTISKFHVLPNFFGVSSAPLIEKDLLIVAVGGSPKGLAIATLQDAKPAGSAIVAFDKKTGDVKYATIHEKRVGLYFARGGLLAFDAETGKNIAHFPWRSKLLESAIAANPVVVEDRILISESYEIGSALLKLKGNQLEPIWTDRQRDRDEKSLMAHFCTPIYHEGFVYGGSSRHSSQADLRCVDLKTGEVAWCAKRTRWCTLLKVDGHLLSLHENGELRLIKLDPKKYTEVARWESPDLELPSWAPPVLSHGRLYVRGKDRLLCYELIPNKP